MHAVTKDPTRVYFPSLNGLRFIAALLVIISHIEQIKSLIGLPNIWRESPFIDIIGKLGVVLFFSLSGYLITYLLLTEKKVTKTIAVKDFYIRRILRIWPLYFLIILISLFILPEIEFFNLGIWTTAIKDHFILKLILFILFLPNLVLIMFPPVAYAAQTWSIGVEEQFYLIWPVMVKHTKRIVAALVIIILLYLTIKYGLSLVYKYLYKQENLLSTINFINIFNIDCMAIGGLFACMAFKENINSLLWKVLTNKLLQACIYSVVIIFISLGIKLPYLHFEFYSVLFSYIIFNISQPRTSLVTLEFRILNYLGKISYGLYMFHPIVILATIKTLNTISITNNYLIYLFSILLTIGISSLSYDFFEKRFLKKKNKYSKVISGDAAKV